MKEKIYIITKDYLQAVRNFLGKLPYNESWRFVRSLKEEMTEQEVNDLLGFIGRYPYDEVEAFFVAANEHIKEKAAEEGVEQPTITEVAGEVDKTKTKK